MKIFITIAFVPVLLGVIDARTIAPEISNAVVCLYSNTNELLNTTIDVEDIDAALCTHLLLDHTAVHQILLEYHTQNDSMWRSNIGGMLQKFERLKGKNPELKLIVQIRYNLDSIKNVWTPSGGSNATKNTVSFLKEMGIHGFDFRMDFTPPENLDEIADIICEMKTEFDKHGFMITITSKNFFSDSGGLQGQNTNNYTKLARCCDYVQVLTLTHTINETQRLSSLRGMKASVDLFIERGFPSNKIMMAVPPVGIIYYPVNPLDTGLAPSLDFKSTPEIKNLSPNIIFNREITKQMKNSSFEWNIRRDEETKEPYAFIDSGVWIFYDDRTSMEFKANYVLEKGLGGITIFPINTEDSEGIGGEGRFPLTRAAYNTFRRL